MDTQIALNPNLLLLSQIIIIIIIIIIISYFDWVAISLRLLLRPPVSHTLTHTHNQIKSNSKCLVAAVGHLLNCPRLVAGGCREKKLQMAHRWSSAFCPMLD